MKGGQIDAFESVDRLAPGREGVNNVWPRQDHPERRPDEVFLGNFTEAGFDASSWRTKRLGEKAYDPIRAGEVLPDTRPVFVKIEEVKKNSVNLPEEL